MRNYNEILTKAKTYPGMRQLVEEAEEMKSKGFNIKTHIEVIKLKIEDLISKEVTYEN